MKLLSCGAVVSLTKPAACLAFIALMATIWLAEASVTVPAVSDMYVVFLLKAKVDIFSWLRSMVDKERLTVNLSLDALTEPPPTRV